MQILERPGCTLHYHIAGSTDQPLIVCLHGAGMDHRMFEPQFAALADRYRVLAWDARGHGQSQPIDGPVHMATYVDDCLALLDHVGSEQAVFIGQSMGGYIAQHVYRRAPQRVRALVSIGSTSIALPYSRWEVWTLQATRALFAVWPYGHFAQLSARNTAITPTVQAYAQEAMRQLDARTFAAIWQAVTEAISPQGLPDEHIQVPLLLTHGDQDNTGTIKRDAPKWAAYEPHARYEVIPNAGHNANQDNPEFFNKLLLAFLGEHGI
jgi:3-oxoadipate enol-lactonase